MRLEAALIFGGEITMGANGTVSITEAFPEGFELEEIPAFAQFKVLVVLDLEASEIGVEQTVQIYWYALAEGRGDYQSLTFTKPHVEEWTPGAPLRHFVTWTAQATINRVGYWVVDFDGPDGFLGATGIVARMQTVSE